MFYANCTVSENNLKSAQMNEITECAENWIIFYYTNNYIFLGKKPSFRNLQLKLSFFYAVKNLLNNADEINILSKSLHQI